MKFKTKIVAPSFIDESIYSGGNLDFGKIAVNAYAEFSVVESAPEHITDFFALNNRF